MADEIIKPNTGIHTPVDSARFANGLAQVKQIPQSNHNTSMISLPDQLQRSKSSTSNLFSLETMKTQKKKPALSDIFKA